MTKFLGFRFKEEICNFQFWKAVRAEFLGTLFYVFLGCGSTVILSGYGDNQYDEFGSLIQDSKGNNAAEILVISLTFGLIVATLSQCIGHVSGAHLNPAVSITMFLTKNITLVRTLFYLLGQTVGGLSGTGIIYGIVGHRVNGSQYFLPVPASDIHCLQAFATEFMVTFIYVFTVCANLEPRRIEMGSRSLSIGLSVTMSHLVALNISGAALNPIRALGPALICGVWKSHWVYWAGPILGAASGGFTFEYTQDSQSEWQYLRRTLRRPLNRSSSAHTEFTFSPSSTFENLRSTS